MAHWNPDSEKTPPWSVEEQNELAHAIDREIVNIALDLWFDGHSDRTPLNFVQYMETLDKAQFQLFKRLRKRRAGKKST